MKDITLGDTRFFNFTTRAFGTGIPTVLAGTPVISIYEDNSVTQITAGITLIVSLDGVVGLNNVAVVATGGNGFESGKDYSLVITTGTVGGVSVVGEVVGGFSVEASAAAQDLANATDGLGAIKTDTAAILLDTAEIGTAGAGLTNINLPDQTMNITGNLTGNVSGSVGSVTAAVTVGTMNANVINAASIAVAAMNGKGDWNIGKTGYTLTQSFPTNFAAMVITGAGSVDSLVQGYLNTLMTEVTTGRIAGNFGVFYRNADALTTQVVDDVGGGGGGGTDWTASERNEIRGRLGVTGTTAAGGNTPTLSTQSSVDTIDGIVDNILIDTTEIGIAGAGLTNINLPNQTMDIIGNITGNLSGSVGSVTGAVLIDATSVDLIWDEVLTGATHNVNNSSGKRLRALSGAIFEDGTAQSGGNNSIQLASGDVTIDDRFKRSKVIIVGGTGAGQEAIITSSIASTDTLTITPAWLVNPDATSEYEILPAQTHSTVRNGGYDDASVFVDTNSSNTGTEEGVDGTSTNPVNNLTDAYVIAANENLTRFSIAPGSAITLPSSSTNRQFVGTLYTVALNGQEIGDMTITGASQIAGIGINTAGGPPAFFTCGMGTVTLPPSNGFEVGFFGTFTMGSAGNFTYGGSASLLGLGLTLDFGLALNASSFNLQSWGGGTIEIQNAGAGTGSYLFAVNGESDLTINANCSATTTVILRGNNKLTNNATGITIDDTANITQTQADIAALNDFDPANDTVANVTLVDTTTTNTDMISFDDIWTTQLTESYAADGVAPTPAQAMFIIQQFQADHASVSVTKTVFRLNGTTPAATYTYDDATNPTSLGRAT